MQEFLNKKMLPSLYASMKEAGVEMIPYVESREKRRKPELRLSLITRGMFRVMQLCLAPMLL